MLRALAGTQDGQTHCLAFMNGLSWLFSLQLVHEPRSGQQIGATARRQVLY
jgi:hypothetical protein